MRRVRSYFSRLFDPVDQAEIVQGLIDQGILKVVMDENGEQEIVATERGHEIAEKLRAGRDGQAGEEKAREELRRALTVAGH